MPYNTSKLFISKKCKYNFLNDNNFSLFLDDKKNIYVVIRMKKFNFQIIYIILIFNLE